MVRDYLSFDQVSECVGVPMEDIVFFNPQYTKQIIPASADKHYELRLPMKYALRFVQLEDSIYSYVSKEEAKREQIAERSKR